MILMVWVGPVWSQVSLQREASGHVSVDRGRECRLRARGSIAAGFENGGRGREQRKMLGSRYWKRPLQVEVLGFYCLPQEHGPASTSF